MRAGNRVELSITVANASRARVVRLTGEFDLAGVELFEDRPKDDGGDETKTTVFDLRDLEFMDSSGLRALIMAESRLRAAGDRVVVVVSSGGQVAELLSLTGVSARLEIADEIPARLGLERRRLGFGRARASFEPDARPALDAIDPPTVGELLGQIEAEASDEVAAAARPGGLEPDAGVLDLDPHRARPDHHPNADSIFGQQSRVTDAVRRPTR